MCSKVIEYRLATYIIHYIFRTEHQLSKDILAASKRPSQPATHRLPSLIDTQLITDCVHRDKYESKLETYSQDIRRLRLYQRIQINDVLTPAPYARTSTPPVAQDSLAFLEPSQQLVNCPKRAWHQVTPMQYIPQKSSQQLQRPATGLFRASFQPSPNFRPGDVQHIRLAAFAIFVPRSKTSWDSSTTSQTRRPVRWPRPKQA